MKKSAFLIPLVALLCLLFALALVSCGEEPAPTPACQHRDADDNALCDKCGEGYTDGADVTPPVGDDTPAHTHALTRHALVAPTCTAEGRLEYWECTACGKFFPDTFANAELADLTSMAIPVLEHIPATTWTSDDTDHWHECTRSGCTVKLDQTAHAYGEWTETLAPTCVAEGSHYKTCTTCTHKVTEDIPVDATAHAPVNTWTKDGTNHWKACTRMGCEAKLNEATHSYGVWVETLAATCVAEGSHYKTCTTCTYKVIEAIPVDTTAHAPATAWTSDGTNHWKVCTRTGCGAKVNEATHTYGEWEETLAATCVAEGSHYKVCTICSHKVIETTLVDPTAHSLGAWITDGSKHWKLCTRAGCEVKLSEGAHTPATAWTTNQTNHWHNCITCGYDIDSVAHVYDAENTCICLQYKDTGVAFKLSNGTYTVTDYTGSATIVIIPSKYKGTAVTAIGTKAFDGCNTLTSVTFGENSQLIAIGDCAFRGCRGLQSLTIPSSVISISTGAFSGCTGLKEITLGANCRLTTIGSYAFEDCDSLQKVTFGENSQLQTIGYGAFYSCSSLETITIPASVITISPSTFDRCSNLSSVVFENTSGWRCAFSPSDTSGTVITSTDLANPTTAVRYLKGAYMNRYWICG